MKTIITLILFLVQLSGYSQTQSWHALPNAPLYINDRNEDLFFINSSTGWVINLDGHVYKTTSAGDTWDTVTSLGRPLRSTGFFDSNTGIIGTLNITNLLYRTSNGGLNWTDISSSIQGVKPKGICGISVINSSTAYACGRYNCPANIIKTTDSGLNWISQPIDTSQISSLIDCLFWTSDSGIVVGGYSPTNNYLTGHSVILLTGNGGLNWTRVYYSSRANEWCWKINFVNHYLGFVSIENHNAPTFILKTINGGFNWQEIQLPSYITDLEGIGFINESTGWVGGWGSNYQMPNYETTDGGTTWHPAGWGINMNRIRFLADTLAYSVGETVYKFTSEPIGIHQISTVIPKSFQLYQNYPNPFNPNTKIKLEVPTGKNNVQLKVFDVTGKEAATLVNESLDPGTYEADFDGSKFASGIYFYKLISGDFVQVKKMVMVK